MIEPRDVGQAIPIGRIARECSFDLPGAQAQGEEEGVQEAVVLSRAPQRQGVGTDAGEDAVQVLLSELYETSSFQGNN